MHSDSDNTPGMMRIGVDLGRCNTGEFMIARRELVWRDKARCVGGREAFASLFSVEIAPRRDGTGTCEPRRDR